MNGSFEKIDGMVCAPFTPFDHADNLDTSVIPRYARMLTEAGVVGVFVNGSSGEGHLLTDDERRATAEKWVEAAPPGFKVIVHVGSNSVRASHALAEHAQRIGAWGTGAMGPTFPPIQRIAELVDYCEQIASGAEELPFYYYHIPALSRVDQPMVSLLQAVEGRIDNFAGLKYTFESLYEYTRCRRYGNSKFDILHGQDETLLAALALGGGNGTIGGTFNYAAGLYAAIYQAWEAGDIDRAQGLQFQAMDMIDVVGRYRGNIVAGKRIMALIGLDLGCNRTPFRNLSELELEAMQGELRAIGFFDFCNRPGAA